MIGLPVGAVLYAGPSRLPGQRRRPIVAILTGLARPSANPKTGPMSQLWILPADEHVSDAIRSGGDAGICGSCPLRGPARSCYVNLLGPSSVQREYHAGKYADWTRGVPRGVRLPYPVRLGAYGDPTAVPLGVVKRLVSRAPGHTGYTHQWGDVAPAWAGLVMASVESDAGRDRAKSLGYRTFRIRPSAAAAVGAREIVCPATPEGGRRTVCLACGLCNGATAGDRRKDIVVVAHGGSGQVANFLRGSHAA